MTGFSTDWLALREPFDQAARAAAAPALDWPALATHLQAAGPVTTVLDLGCGTGATLRAMALRLGPAQRWRLVDHDARLLAAVPHALGPWGEANGLRLCVQGDLLVLEGAGRRIEVERCQADLVAGFADLPFAGAHLVTASALLDLVSAPWLAALVARCRAVGAAVCWALSVDDRMAWDPVDAGDALVQAQFRAHQQRDKGFGPALGGAAAARACTLLEQSGYRVAQAASDWCMAGSRGASDQAMLHALVQGIAAAAAEQAPAHTAAVQAWQARRLTQWAGTRLRVGHQDLLGWIEGDAG